MAEIIKLGSTGNWGVKPNGVLAYNDENNVFKAIELQSSRASGATYVGEDGLIKDAEVGVPRIDYTNGVGELLLEPQSTNLITYSEEFDTYWSKNYSLANDNYTISPSGESNACRLIDDDMSGLDRVGLFKSFSLTSGSTYTFSVFAKKDQVNFISLRTLNFSSPSNGNSFFDLENGTLGTIRPDHEAKIEDYGNGWYRCSISFTVSGADPDGILGIYANDIDNDPLPPRDGTTSIFIYGAQVEQLSYPTSYIRTEGSQVTRIADAVTGNSSLGQVINSSEGVLYFEGSALVNGADGRITLSDGSISNRVSIEWDALANTIKGFMGSNVVQTSDYNQTNTLKIALHYKVNDFKMFINGFYVAQDTNVSAQINLNTLSFDNATGSNDFYGRIRELKVYDTALTDAELTTLTTI